MTERAIVVGPDVDGLGEALRGEGLDVTSIEAVATRPELEEAGIVAADLLVVTDVGQATAIPISKDLNPGLRVVVYDRQSLPEFVSAQTDLAVDPKLVDALTVAEELAATR